jgi:membrane associated rhomboid family serine protease
MHVIRSGISITIAFFAGVAVVFLFPPPWLAPLSILAGICFAVFASVVRFSAKAESPVNPAAGLLLTMINIPEQPLAKVVEGWAFTAFLSSTAFLIALALSVMVRANA